MLAVAASVLAVIVVYCGGSEAPGTDRCGVAGSLCDDGNTASGDGCSSECRLEPGWSCTTPHDGELRCTPVCGDGLLVGAEVCDDRNVRSGDGCSPRCQIEDGWSCQGEPSACARLSPRVRTPPALGAPLPLEDVPPHAWKFLHIDSTECAAGPDTPLLAVSKGSDDLLLVLEGGWPCSDYEGCCSKLGLCSDSPPAVGPSASVVALPGPRPRIAGSTDNLDLGGTVFDRGDENNPFRDFTFVVIDACTGDFHSGNSVVTYRSDGGAGAVTIHHKGHANLVAFLARIAATWPSPPRLVVAGGSQGGFGVLLNYDTIRLYWPDQVSFLIDDSGPALSGAGFPGSAGGGTPVPDAWRRWNLAETVGEICPECETDFSAIYAALARWYPNDRKSLLTHLGDPNIEWVYGRSTSPYWSDAEADAWLAASLRSTLPALRTSHWTWFYAPEKGHVLLIAEKVDGGYGHPAPSLQPGLQDFLRKQLEQDPSWSPVTPSP